MAGLIQHTIDTPYMVGPVHCYSGTVAGEPVLFDTGPPTPGAERYLRENIDLASLRHVIVTHCHIDHYGLAHWLEKNSNATIYLPYRDCLKISRHDRRMKEMYDLLFSLGFSREYLADLQRIFDSGVLFPPYPKNFKVAETDLPARLGITVVNCPGHSQSDLVYTAEDWAVTGDTLLRGIYQSPLLDVDLEEGGRFNNYEAYCSSIVKLAGLKGRRVLPGHRVHADVEETILFYIEKLLIRVEQLRPLKDEKNLLVLIDKLLDGRIQDTFHLFLKASEVVFMQDLLEAPEMFRQALEKIGLFGRVEKLYHSATGC